jgi:hypothetical protein
VRIIVGDDNPTHIITVAVAVVLWNYYRKQWLYASWGDVLNRNNYFTGYWCPGEHDVAICSPTSVDIACQNVAIKILCRA